MIEELEFIEQLQIDILIDIHNERVSQFERDMEEEHAQVYAFSSRHDKSEHKEG